MPISPEQQAAFLADLKKFRAALAEDFQPPDDWPHGDTPLDGKPPWPRVNAYRGEVATPLFALSAKFSKADFEALPWPNAAKDLLYRIHESLHLLTQPHGRRILRESIDAFLASIQSKPVKLANEARDQWLYEQCVKLVPYPTIIIRLRKRPKWEPLNTINGVKRAAKAHAVHANLPPIPGRQHGRKAADR